MFYIALGILKNHALSEEAVQDALLKILLHIDDIEEINCHKTRSWVVYIIRRVSLNKLKYEKRREHMPDKFFETMGFENESTLEDEAIRHLEIDRIVAAIRHIDEYCNIIVLKYYFGCTDSKLAKHYTISAEAARKRIERCKKKLKQYLGHKRGASE